ncbi:MAG: hypothetical protein JST68_11185 [Bacteroidetes bacterium]|nr:hypothetical protein [Bacteroidota bacterium]
MKKLIGVFVILFTLLLTVIYRQLTGSRVKEKTGHVCLFRLREELPLFQMLIQ